MAGSNVVHIKTDNWKNEVMDSAVPVLVDFWATWCGPCKTIAPVLDELSTELAGKLKIAKVDVDENQELAMKYSIRSIPTLLVFVRGEVKEQIVGAQSKAVLQSKLSAYL